MTINVTPLGPPSAVGVNGYAWNNLNNVSDATLLARLLGLGFTTTGRPPHLLDFTETYGMDPTGDNDSTVALRAFAAQCSTDGVVGFGDDGIYLLGEGQIDFFNGSGLSHGLGRVATNVPGQVGCNIFYSPATADYYNEVPFPIHPGNEFRFNVHYPLLLAESLAALDADGVGTLPYYAPTFAADCVMDSTGVTHSGGQNCDFFTIDGCFTGPNTAIFAGEAVLDEEPWAVSLINGRAYSVQSGKGVGGYDVYQRGFFTNRGIVRYRNTVTSRVHRDGVGIGPQCWHDLSLQTNKVLTKYAQANAIGTVFGHRGVGVQTDGIVRCVQTWIKCIAGPPPIGVTTPTGNDGGRYNSSTWDGGLESTPCLLDVEPEAFLLGITGTVTARCKDNTSSQSVQDATTVPVFNIQTDYNIAGLLKKDGTWATSQNEGTQVDITAIIKVADGPILVTNANHPSGIWAFRPGSRLSNWNINNASASDQSGYGVQHLGSANNHIITMDAVTVNTHYGNDHFFWGAQDTSGDADSNVNFGQVEGFFRDAMKYFGFDAPDASGSNYAHLCNIQPYSGNGEYFDIGFPDDSTDDDGDDS